MYDEIGLEGQSSAYVCCLDIPVVALNRTQRLEKQGALSHVTLILHSVAQRSLNFIVANMSCTLYFQQERVIFDRNSKPYTASLG